MASLNREKANLTKECNIKLHKVCVKLVSYMCDGATSHQSMLQLLEEQLLPDSLQAYFPHTCDPETKI